MIEQSERRRDHKPSAEYLKLKESSRLNTNHWRDKRDVSPDPQQAHKPNERRSGAETPIDANRCSRRHKKPYIPASVRLSNIGNIDWSITITLDSRDSFEQTSQRLHLIEDELRQEYASNAFIFTFEFQRDHHTKVRRVHTRVQFSQPTENFKTRFQRLWQKYRSLLPTFGQALVQFVRDIPSNCFITIPIGQCDSDEIVLKILGRIENELCRKYLVNRHKKLPHSKRFSMVCAFEGESNCGTRHAHVLAYVPVPTKRNISHEMLVTLFPAEFRALWCRFRKQLLPKLTKVRRNPASDWSNKLMQIEIERANDRRKVYTVKSVRQNEVPWSRLEFVTAPKQEKFTNENLSVIHNRNQQRRKHLKRLGDPLLTGHVA